MDKIEAELLISLVQSRPGLWDKSLDSHKDIVQRSKAWRDICRVFDHGFDTLSRKDKNAFVKAVMKKWTNMRDAWRKTVSEDKKKSKPYVYHEQMKFLLKNLSYKKSECDGDTYRDKTDNESDDAETLASLGHRAKRLRARDVEERNQDNNMLQFMDTNSIPSEDAHISFAKGLLPSLRKLDDDETLEFQAGVIRVLQEVRRRGRGGDHEPFHYLLQHAEVQYKNG